MFCQCLWGRTNLPRSTSEAPPRPPPIGHMYAFKFELGAQDSQCALIGRIVPKEDIKLVCTTNTGIGWTGLLNIRREKPFVVCSHSNCFKCWCVLLGACTVWPPVFWIRLASADTDVLSFYFCSLTKIAQTPSLGIKSNRTKKVSLQLNCSENEARTSGLGLLLQNTMAPEEARVGEICGHTQAVAGRVWLFGADNKDTESGEDSGSREARIESIIKREPDRFNLRWVAVPLSVYIWWLFIL